MIIHHEIVAGRAVRHKFNCDMAYQAYLRNRADIIEHGVEGAMQKWHNEEAKERRHWGLEVKELYPFEDIS